MLLFEQRVINSHSTSLFFNYVNKKLNAARKVVPLSLSCGAKLLSDSDKAEALNAYFTSSFLSKNKIF